MIIKQKMIFTLLGYFWFKVRYFNNYLQIVNLVSYAFTNKFMDF